MSDQDYAVPAGWGQVRPLQTVELPSGGRVLVRELEIQDLLNLDILDIVDSFSQEALPKASVKGSNSEAQFLKNVAENKDQFDKMVDVMNRVAAQAIVKPVVTYVPPPKPGEAEQEAVEGKVYAHLIPLEDRLAVFNKAVAGMEDLFRDSTEQAENVGAVADVQEVQLPAEPASGDIASHPSLLPE